MRHRDVDLGLWCACPAYREDGSSTEPFPVQLPQGTPGELHERCPVNFRPAIGDHGQQVVGSTSIAEEEFAHAHQERHVRNTKGSGNDGVLVRYRCARHVKACKARAAPEQMARYAQVAWLRPGVANPTRQRGLYLAASVGGVDRANHPVPGVAVTSDELRPSHGMLLDAEVLIQKSRSQVGFEL